MRLPLAPQSYFRYPLNRILATEGAVRVLRELLRHGGELTIPQLASATRLNQQTVRNALLGDLGATGIAEPVGQGRFRSYRARMAQPFAPLLAQLFAAEDARVERIYAALVMAGREALPDVQAIWVYGSVARGEDAPDSDLDVALVAASAADPARVDACRVRLGNLLDAEQVSPSVAGLTPEDVLRLMDEETAWWRNVVAEAHAVLGPTPRLLGERLRRSRAA